jgi:hypothetical protein
MAKKAAKGKTKTAKPKAAPARSRVPPAPKPPKPRAIERWQQALALRNMERDELRNNRLRGTPLAKAAVTPIGDHMVKRGTRVMALSRQQASETTRKSWQQRKQKYGKKGRASSLTFNRTAHKRIKS